MADSLDAHLLPHLSTLPRRLATLWHRQPMSLQLLVGVMALTRVLDVPRRLRGDGGGFERAQAEFLSVFFFPFLYFQPFVDFTPFSFPDFL